MALSENGSAFLVSFLFNLILMLLAFFTFCYLRLRLPKVYAPRSYPKFDDSPVPPPGFFSWVLPTLGYSLAWIETHRGVDAMMYQRFLRSITTFFVVFTLLAFVTVVPANATGENRYLNATDPLHTEGLQIISMANIDSDSKVFWVHAVFVVVEVLAVILLLFWDYSCYFSSRERYRLLPTVDHCSVMVVGVKTEHLEGGTIAQKQHSLAEVFNVHFPGQVRSVSLVRDDPELTKMVKDRVATKELFELSLLSQDKGESPNHSAGCCGKKVDSVAHYTEELKVLRSGITEKQAFEYPKISEVAFVTFTSVEAAEKCIKEKLTLSHPKLLLERAPPSPAVNWSKLHVQEISRWIRRLGVNLIIGFMVCFWAIPTTFVQTLGNLREVAKYELFSWLNDVLDALGPTIEGLINSYLPSLLLIALMSAVVPVIRMLSREEGRNTLIKVDQVVLERYLVFLLINVFLVTTVAGSFFGQVFAIFEGEVQIINLLATSLPGQGEFFIEYVMLKFAFLIINKLLRLDDVIIRWIKLKLAKTESQKRAALAPPTTDRAVQMAWDMLVFQITLCYSVMFPFILIFGAAYFATSYLVHQYNCVFVYTKHYETEGTVWQTTYHYMFTAALIFQLTMVGLLSLNTSLSFLPVVASTGVTIVAWLMMRKKIEKGEFGFVPTPSTDMIEYIWQIAMARKKSSNDWGRDERSSLINRYGPEVSLHDALNTVYYRQPEMEPLDDDMDFGWKRHDSEEHDHRRNSID